MAVTCWAKSLGGCSPIQSREHYISKGLFEGDAVKLIGLPWCKFEEKTIGLASASTKILCKTHNERLSNLDDEAIRAFTSIREIFLLQSRQKLLSPRFWKVQTWKVNGRLLERWFLKTAINLMHVQTQAIAWPGATEPRVPTTDVVDACFGLSPIRSPRGLHAVAAVGQDVESSDYVSFAPLTDTTTQSFAGGIFEFRGIRFVLAWTDMNLEPFIRQVTITTSLFANSNESRLLHPFKGIAFKVGDRRAQMLKIVWPPFSRESYT
jgi:hypothetical protein